MSKIDLHMHSGYSNDGEFNVDSLLMQCQQAGLEIIALTDHNNVKGINEAIECSTKYGLTVIPGIELDCVIDGVELHVLGYNIDFKDPRFDQLENSIIEQEQKSTEIRLRKIREIGIDFDEEEVRGMAINGVVTGEMIAESALRLDKALSTEKRNSLLLPFDQKQNPLVDFYWEFCAQGKPAYAPINLISLNEAVQLIKSSGGEAVFAHPSKNIGCNKDLLDKIIAHGVSGIEVYSNYHTEAEKEFYLQYALENNLTITCGSDYHGKTKPSIKLGTFGFDFDERTILDQVGIKKLIG